MTKPVRRSAPVVLVVAWLLILGLVGWIVVRTQEKANEQETRQGISLADLQMRYLVGSAYILGDRKALYRQGSNWLDQGTYLQRLKLVVLAGELQGKTEALNQLRHLDEIVSKSRMPPSANELQVAESLRHLYQDGPDTLFAEDEFDLVRELGWAGKLALDFGPTPEDRQKERTGPVAEAKWTASVANGILFLVICVLGTGLLILLVVLTSLFFGKLKDRWPPASAPHGIYLETFALWLLYYFFGSMIAREFTTKTASLLVSMVLMISSLFVLVWPRIRGLSWEQIRHDIGLIPGDNPLVEALMGAGIWAATLPVLIGLALAYSQLLNAFSRSAIPTDPLAPVKVPAHPVVDSLLRGNFWLNLQIVLAAAVVAPLVEELVFRGLLFRHLREATGRWGKTASVVGSGLISGLIFAAIHPQGLVAIPLLTTLAMAFALVREWRSTLLPSMVAHSLNNACLTLSLIILMA